MILVLKSPKIAGLSVTIKEWASLNLKELSGVVTVGFLEFLMLYLTVWIVGNCWVSRLE